MGLGLGLHVLAGTGAGAEELLLYRPDPRGRVTARLDYSNWNYVHSSKVDERRPRLTFMTAWFSSSIAPMTAMTGPLPSILSTTPTRFTWSYFTSMDAHVHSDHPIFPIASEALTWSSSAWTSVTTGDE